MTSKKLTDAQLQQYQRHADIYPIGDTAQLLAHINYLQEELEALWKLYDPLNLRHSQRYNAKEGGD